MTIPGGNVSGNNKVWRKFTFAPITTSKIRVLATASADGYSRIVELEAWTGPSPAPRYDVALGATATASTSYPGWGPSAVVNGDRKSLNAYSNGAWSSSAANNFPEWVEVNFGASKTINEIHVFTLQDNWAGSTEPTEAMTFTLYGLSGYEVQYWNGSGWLTVPGGSVTGNNKIWRKFTFSPISTSKIRVLTHAAPDGVSRITEIEAYGPADTGGSGNGTQWLVSDHLGTPRIIFDQSGNLENVRRHDYAPFGEELIGVGGRAADPAYGGGDRVRQQFTLKERDVETGLDYFGARYYSSTQGRFTSIDPLDPVLGKQGANNSATANVEFGRYLGQPQNWNRYLYALNNPLKYIDPTGEAPTITVRMNIVWELSTPENAHQGFANEEAARQAAQKYIDYLRKAYGSLDIEFDISFTEGTAQGANSTKSGGAQIDPTKKVGGALNVFLTSRHPNAMGAAHSRENGDIFLNIRANSESRLAHEVAHPFGLSSWPSGHNYTYLGSEWDIDTSLPNMYQGSIKEGIHWVDDYRNATQTRCCVPATEPWRAGNPIGYQVRRSPTTYDILRVGAQRFTGKR